jgi:hypothetical protein
MKYIKDGSQLSESESGGGKQTPEHELQVCPLLIERGKF